MELQKEYEKKLAELDMCKLQLKATIDEIKLGCGVCGDNICRFNSRVKTLRNHIPYLRMKKNKAERRFNEVRVRYNAVKRAALSEIPNDIVDIIFAYSGED